MDAIPILLAEMHRTGITGADPDVVVKHIDAAESLEARVRHRAASLEL